MLVLDPEKKVGKQDKKKWDKPDLTHTYKEYFSRVLAVRI